MVPLFVIKDNLYALAPLCVTLATGQARGELKGVLEKERSIDLILWIDLRKGYFVDDNF